MNAEKPNIKLDAEKKALDTAIDMTKQLITLGTSVVTVVAAVLALLKSVSAQLVTNFIGGLTLMIISILFGILTLGSITAILRSQKEFDITYRLSIRILSIGQWILFLVGLAFLTWSVVNGVATLAVSV